VAVAVGDAVGAGHGPPPAHRKALLNAVVLVMMLPPKSKTSSVGPLASVRIWSVPLGSWLAWNVTVPSWWVWPPEDRPVPT
jgi:hypothetical protein